MIIYICSFKCSQYFYFLLIDDNLNVISQLPIMNCATSGCPLEELPGGWEGLSSSKASAEGRISEETLSSEGTAPDDLPKSRGCKVVLAECRQLPDRAGRGITEQDQEGLKVGGQEGGASRREERTGSKSSRD